MCAVESTPVLLTGTALFTGIKVQVLQLTNTLWCYFYATARHLEKSNAAGWRTLSWLAAG